MKMIHPLLDRLGYLFLLPIAALTVWKDRPTGYLVLAVCGAFLIFNELKLFLLSRKKKKLARTIVDMLNMTSQKRLVEFPVPIVISDQEGNILWYNNAFTDATDETELLTLHNIFQLDENLHQQRVTELEFDRKYYTAYMDCYQFDSRGELFIHYLFDTTEHHRLQREFRMSKPIVAYLLLDNYDEVFTGMKESERTACMAKIDQEVNNWAQSSGGILCHSDRERYLFVFEARALVGFAKSRFDIMDRVRSIDTGTRLSPTLSIGIGMNGGGFAKNEEAARTALDMALSRGGDQTVIRSDRGFEFFGARGRSGERRTRVKTRVIANALSEHLKSVQTMLIMGHSFGDMDCLGAAVGMARIAAERAIEPKIIVDESTDLTGKLLQDLKEDREHRNWFISPREAEEYITPATTVVVVDTHKAANTVAPEVLKKTENIIIIDHHRKGVDCISDPLLSYQEPYASSASEMVTELFHYLDVLTIPESEANALLAGIFLDTKNFTLRTNTCTFEAASTLRKAGANTVKVKKYFQTDMATYRDKVNFISNAETYRKQFAVAVWDGDAHGNLKIAAAQAADEMLGIENVRASFTLFTDRNGNVNVSGRSYGEINVQVILEKFGNGGGHMTMAGAFIRGSTAEEEQRRLLKFIDEYLAESEAAK